MLDQETTALFHEIYDKTYVQTAVFVTKRCDDPMQVSDILQEIYADVYSTMICKPQGYIKKPEAFVQHITKKKLARYYSYRSRMNRWLSLFSTHQETGEEYEEVSILIDPLVVETQVENKLLVAEISKVLAGKQADIQKIFQLHYGLDLPIRQVALELGLSESTVKTKIYRTLIELRKIYRKDDMPL